MTRLRADALPPLLILPAWGLAAIAAVGLGLRLAATALGHAAPEFGPGPGLAGHGAALATGAVWIGLGWPLTAGRAPRSPFDRALLAGLLGFAIATTVLLALAGLDRLGAGPVAALAGAAAVGGGRAGAAWARESLRRGGRAWRAASGSERLAAVGVLALAGLLAAPLVLQSLLPSSDWDSALYQLPLAERYLAGRLGEPDLLVEAWSFPGALQLVYAAWLSVDLEAAVIPLNLWASVGLCVVAARIAGELAPGAGPWAAAVLGSNAIVWELGLDPRIDGCLALFAACAVYGLLRALEDRSGWVIAGLATGAAIGCKFTGLFFGGLTGAVGLALWGLRGRPGGALLATGVAAAVLLPNGYWYAANAAHFGDPLYPMLRGFYYTELDGRRVSTRDVLEPVLAELPERSPVRALERRLASVPVAESRSNLFAPIELFLVPERFAVKPLHAASPLLLLALGLLARLRARDPARLASGLVLGLALAWVGILGARTHLLRYVVPALPLLAAAAGAVLATRRSAAVRGVWALVVAASLCGVAVAEAGKLAGTPWRALLAGERTRLQWLTEVGYNGQTAMPRMVAAVNRDIAEGRMPSDSRILMIGEGKGRLLACESLPDHTWYQRRWLVAYLRGGGSVDGAASLLRAEGVTHVLYNAEYYNWVLRNVPPRDAPRDQLALAMNRLDAFLRRHGEGVHHIDGLSLFRLRETAGSPDRVD